MVNHGEPKNGPSPDGGTPKMGVGPQLSYHFFWWIFHYKPSSYWGIPVYPCMEIPIDTIYPLFGMTECQVMPWSKPQDVQGHWSGYGALSGANGGKSVWDELSNGHLKTPTMFLKGHVNYTHIIYIYIYNIYIYV